MTGNSVGHPADDPVKLVASALLAQKGQLEFLCEAALPESVTLDGLLNDLRRSCNGWLDRDKKLALARAAVGVCFEHEDEGGLVVPFMNRLGVHGEEECRRAWGDRIGPAIRTAILEWAGSVPQFHWKYVGPVRVHTGVPRLLIPRFARLLFDIACEHGLEALPSLPRKSLGATIETAFAGTTFASEFLLSETGDEFTRAAGAVISRAGWPTNRDAAHRVATEPGFHRGFLSQVVAELNQLLEGEPRRPRRGVPSELWPHLVVLERFGRVALRFPGLVGTRRCRYTWDQGGPGTLKPVMQFGRSVQYRDFFTGDIEVAELEGEWSVRAWPRRGSRWALFDLQGAMVASHGESDTVDSGEYLAAIMDDKVRDLEAAAGASLRANLGPLDFDGASVGEFTLLHVALDSGTKAIDDLSVLGHGTVPRLDWARRHPLAELAADVDAVLSPSEAFVLVKDWSTERAAQFRLTLEIGSDVHDVTARLQALGNGHRLALPQHSHTGVIRIEGRGRRTGSQRSESVMSYAVWPEMAVTRSHPVLGSEEVGVVSVQPMASVEVVDLEGWPIAGPLEVRPPDGTVSFGLRHQQERLELHARIPRARITLPSGPHSPAFIDREDVEKAALSPVVSRLGDFVVHAAPGIAWKLCMRSREGVGVLFEVSQPEAERGPSGRYPLRWSQVLDSVRSSPASVGALELVQCGRTLPLNAFVLNSDRLSRPGKHCGPEVGIPAELRLVLERIESLQAGNPPSGLSLAAPNDALQRIVDAWEACAKVAFGATERLSGRALHLAEIVQQSQSRQRPLVAARLLEQLAQLGPEAVLTECGVSPEFWPTVWRERFAETKRVLAGASDLVGLMRGLRQSVLQNTKLPDADIPDGLFNGLRQYWAAFTSRPTSEQAARAESALRQMRGAAMVGAEPWNEVARSFVLLTLLRRGHVTEFIREYLATDPGCALPVCLARAADSLRGVADSERTPECPWCLSDVSPLADDSTLVCGELAGSDGTWLTSWLFWRRSVQRGDPITALRQQAVKRGGEIPGTLHDRDRIMNELELGRLAEWQ